MADRTSSFRSDDRGSVLMLMPAAVLIVIVLGALAVDRAIVFADQRELVATAQSAANDGAAVGVDVARVRGDNQLRFDRTQVDQAIRRNIALNDDPEHPVTVTWHLDGDEIVVELRREAEHLFAKAVPGTDRTTTVRATARARLATA